MPPTGSNPTESQVSGCASTRAVASCTSGKDPAIARAIELLDSARSVTVLCHIYPDADTMGSGLALALVLHRRGVPVEVSFAEPTELAAALADLPGAELVSTPQEVAAASDLVVVVDAASRGRLGALDDRLDNAGAVLVVDHHRTNTRFGTVNIVDSSAEATAVIVTRILDEWGVELDPELAHCLFAGLVTDTGCFRWAGPAAHHLAARLIDTGIDTAAITRSLFDTHPYARLPMLASVLSGAQLVPGAAGGAGLVHAVVRQEDLVDLPADEMETIIDIVRATSEADVAAVVKQLGERRWSVSLRSKTQVDVAAVAISLGGGGHQRSAGFTFMGTSEQAVAALVTALG